MMSEAREEVSQEEEEEEELEAEEHVGGEHCVNEAPIMRERMVSLASEEDMEGVGRASNSES
jgi:hypothetical protein